MGLPAVKFNSSLSASEPDRCKGATNVRLSVACSTVSQHFCSAFVCLVCHAGAEECMAHCWIVPEVRDRSAMRFRRFQPRGSPWILKPEKPLPLRISSTRFLLQAECLLARIKRMYLGGGLCNKASDATPRKSRHFINRLSRLSRRSTGLPFEVLLEEVSTLLASKNKEPHRPL